MAPTAPLTGDALLSAVSSAMVALHERHHHRTPATATTHLMGDEVLACVMGGVYTDVEKTMIELQRDAVVRETRGAFHNAVRATYITEVQRLSGRRVTDFISKSHVGPDLQVDLFVLAPAA